MRTLVVGDVHGCADELRRLVDIAAPTRIILVGDMFSRGPDPLGVWALIRDRGMEAVLGNGDLKTLALHRTGGPLPAEAVAWLAALPWVIKGKTPERRWAVVHAGVNPVKGLKGTTRTQALGLSRWPGRSMSDPLWWQLYERRRLIVHGHHARFGLVDRRPHSLGLDTGCVGGGQLTGYLIEDDALISVKSRVTGLVPASSHAASSAASALLRR